MSHPNGEQAEPTYPTAATSQPPSSFEQSAAQFTAAATTPAITPTTPAITPATPASAASVEAAPVAPAPVAPAPAAPASVAPTEPAAPNPWQPGVAQHVHPATQPVYAAGSASIPPAAQANPGYARESNTSAFPVTGVPVSGYPMPVAEPKRKRTGTILLTVATIVLGLATAGFGTMYFLEADKRRQADKKVTEQAAALDAADKKLKETESKLGTSKEENAKLTQDLTGAKNKTDEVTKVKDALIACMQASEAYAANRNSNTAKDLIVKCAEAEKYL